MKLSNKNLAYMQIKVYFIAPHCLCSTVQALYQVWLIWMDVVRVHAACSKPPVLIVLMTSGFSWMSSLLHPLSIQYRNLTTMQSTTILIGFFLFVCSKLCQLFTLLASVLQNKCQRLNDHHDNPLFLRYYYCWPLSVKKLGSWTIARHFSLSFASISFYSF